MDSVSIPALYLISLIIGALGALGGWLFALWRSHHQHVTHSERTYVTRPELQQAIKALREEAVESNRLIRALFSSVVNVLRPIAERLSIPTSLDYPEPEDANRRS